MGVDVLYGLGCERELFFEIINRWMRGREKKIVVEIW